MCTALAMAHDSLPMVLWESDNVMQFNGMVLEMNGIKLLLQKELEEAEQILKDDIMRGLFTKDMEFQLDHILDDLRNQDAGYSFLQHPQNPFEKA